LALGLAGQFICILNNPHPIKCAFRLVVILIGRLRLSPSQAIEAYMKLEAVMPIKPAKDDQERSRNFTAFRTAFIEVLKEAGFEADTPMVDENMPKM
jgi:hypothetical protein